MASKQIKTTEEEVTALPVHSKYWINFDSPFKTKVATHKSNYFQTNMKVEDSFYKNIVRLIDFNEK